MKNMKNLAAIAPLVLVIALALVVVGLSIVNLNQRAQLERIDRTLDEIILAVSQSSDAMRAKVAEADKTLIPPTQPETYKLTIRFVDQVGREIAPKVERVLPAGAAAIANNPRGGYDQ